MIPGPGNISNTIPSNTTTNPTKVTTARLIFFTVSTSATSCHPASYPHTAVGGKLMKRWSINDVRSATSTIPSGSPSTLPSSGHSSGGKLIKRWSIRTVRSPISTLSSRSQSTLPVVPMQFPVFPGLTTNVWVIICEPGSRKDWRRSSPIIVYVAARSGPSSKE